MEKIGFKVMEGEIRSATLYIRFRATATSPPTFIKTLLPSQVSPVEFSVEILHHQVCLGVIFNLQKFQLVLIFRIC